jgi:hypothetical protein
MRLKVYFFFNLNNKKGFFYIYKKGCITKKTLKYKGMKACDCRHAKFF